MPRFSLVIPTLRRADTLEHALTTLLLQPADDVEIVVQNNGNDAEVRDCVAAATDPRVRHFATESVLSMAENWELALQNTRGDWVAFIGDDDGLVPDACEVMSSIDGVDDFELVTWPGCSYVWPTYHDERRRNRVEVEIDFAFRVKRIASLPFLERFYRFDVHYAQLPMIYNAFVRRTLIDRVRARQGKYFLGSLPDLTSGISNVAACDAFLRMSRPLSVSGASHNSTGHNTWIRTDRAIDDNAFARDFPELARDDRGFPAWNLDLAIAAEMHLLRPALPNGDALPFDVKRLVQNVAAAINARPDRYEDTVDVIHRLAEAAGIDPGDVRIPARVERAPVVPRGVVPLGGSRVRIIIDGDAVGLRSIADAAALVGQLVPSAEAVTWEEERADVPAVSSGRLSFARGADGEAALVDGWSESETWGTWSIGRESRIRFALPPKNGRARRHVRLSLRYRVIAGPNAAPLEVECVYDGRVVHRWTFDGQTAQGETPIELPSSAAKASPVELTFRVLNPRSPAELQLGPDDRLLGLGIEELRVLS